MASPGHQERQVQIQLLGRLSRVAVHSNLVIAGSAVGVAATTVILADLPSDPIPFLFVFVAAWVTYTANRFTDRREDQQNVPDRTQFMRRYGCVLVTVSGGAYLILLVIVAATIPRMLPVAILPIVGIAIYATWWAKRVFLVKNSLVGLVWAMIPIGFGLLYGEFASWRVLALAGVICWQITIAAALFDIKDIRGDRVVGSLTLPVLVGPAWTRRFALGGGLLLAVPIVWAAAAIDPRFLVLGGYVVHIIAVVPFASVERGSLFYGLVIDGEHMMIAAIAIAVGVL